MNYNPILPLLLLAIGILAGIPMVSATSDALVAFNEHYDTNGTRLDSCIVCHGSNVESLNPYGAAYQNDNGDFTVIETQDSDGDGFSDLDEVNALTFPGNPEDYPGNISTVPLGTNETVGEPINNASERLGNASERLGNASETVSNVSERVSNATDEREEQSPGFEAVIAVFGLFAVVCLKRVYTRK